MNRGGKRVEKASRNTEIMFEVKSGASPLLGFFRLSFEYIWCASTFTVAAAILHPTVQFLSMFGINFTK